MMPREITESVKRQISKGTRLVLSNLKLPTHREAGALAVHSWEAIG